MFWRIILTNSVKIKLSTINIHYVEFRASRSKLNSTRWFQLITNFNLTTTFTLSSRCKSNNSYSRWRSAANIFKHNPQWWKTKLVRYLILGWCDGIKIRIIVVVVVINFFHIRIIFFGIRLKMPHLDCIFILLCRWRLEGTTFTGRGVGQNISTCEKIRTGQIIFRSRLLWCCPCLDSCCGNYG